MSETLNNPPRTVEDTYTYDDSLWFRDLKGLLVLHKLLAISFLHYRDLTYANAGAKPCFTRTLS